MQVSRLILSLLDPVLFIAADSCPAAWLLRRPRTAGLRAACASPYRVSKTTLAPALRLPFFPRGSKREPTRIASQGCRELASRQSQVLESPRQPCPTQAARGPMRCALQTEQAQFRRLFQQTALRPRNHFA